MKILHLTLKKKWFDMIASGEKKEEYREIKSYWDQRLNRKYDFIVFKNGYSKDSPQLVVELKEIVTGPGRTKWGAPESKPVYILKLGEIFSMPKILTNNNKADKIKHEGCEKCEFYNKELDSCTDSEEYIIYVCRHQSGAIKNDEANVASISHDWINGLRLTIEKGHICLINHFNCPVWVRKIESVPEGGFNLTKILDKAWKNEGKTF